MISIITPQDTLNIISNAYVARTHEIHMYQINIDNFTAMLADLPLDNAPDNILQYLDVDVKDLPEALSDQEVQIITAYAYRSELKKRVRAERAEQSKVQRLLDALKNQIPADKFDEIIAQTVQSAQV